ncbi:zinc ribbon-containing protein [Pontibacter sp. JAM-7]|uniref:zinc ribbon-containing protein n=1 Tax=Pontibacter sp. JAM-7 TaxID=3366581 RepID=UPI003AF6FE3A
MDNKTNKNSQLSAKDYDRVLQRLTRTLEQAEVQSWDVLQEQIREAAELELAAEEMTKDELSLLTAYLQRDLKTMGFYAHETGRGIAAWLKFDLDALEGTLAGLLTKVADQTRVAHEELRERIGHADEQYMAGELATAGTLHCLGCGAEQILVKTGKLQPCGKCGERFFSRPGE